MAEMVTEWLAQLAAVGWVPDRHWKRAAKQMALPGLGLVVWIDGSYQGVPRAAWLGMISGVVTLHGSNVRDDVAVPQFCLNCVKLPPKKVVHAQHEQLELFG